MKNPLLAFVLLIAVTGAQAHTRSESWSAWSVDGREVRGEITLPTLEASRLPSTDEIESLSQVFARYAATRIHVYDATGECPQIESSPLRTNDAYVRAELRFRCDTEPVRMVYDVLFERAPGHVHFARHGDAPGNDSVITSGQRSLVLGGVSPRSSRLGDYVQLGAQHILSGIDHLAFLLGLLLVARGWRELAVAVTGFTLGHSLTLGLSVTGFVEPRPDLVEAFIGFSVALVAIEAVVRRSPASTAPPLAAALLAASGAVFGLLLGGPDLREALAFLGLALFAWCYLQIAAARREDDRHRLVLPLASVAFGLVHGFGFAGFLRGTGLGQDAVALPLFGFNLGVELGQLLMLSAALAAGAGAARLLTTRALASATSFAATALCGLGVYWFVARIA